jgi:hypothetical protein
VRFLLLLFLFLFIAHGSLLMGEGKPAFSAKLDPHVTEQGGYVL